MFVFGEIAPGSPESYEPSIAVVISDRRGDDRSIVDGDNSKKYPLVVSMGSAEALGLYDIWQQYDRGSARTFLSSILQNSRVLGDAENVVGDRSRISDLDEGYQSLIKRVGLVVVRLTEDDLGHNGRIMDALLGFDGGEFDVGNTGIEDVLFFPDDIDEIRAIADADEVGRNDRILDLSKESDLILLIRTLRIEAGSPPNFEIIQLNPS